MAQASSEEPSRRLLDHVAGPRELGAPQAVFATTFDLSSSFVELDFLPTVLHVSSWDDASVKGRIELEQQLARVETVALAMEGRRYVDRPRSLRVHLTPASLPGGSVLHAKVTLIVHDEAVRLLVGSANLTEAGYRHNREVGLSIVADPKRPTEARLIAQALAPMRTVLARWWNEHTDKVVGAAEQKLADWQEPGVDDDAWFLWSGPGNPLWRRFVALWPEGEPINEIVVVSPFWSSEGAEGPFSRFIQALRARGAMTEGTILKLVTRAERDRQTTFCPTLPAGLASFDFRTLGLSASAAAADPKVAPEDVGREDILRERGLHAKIVLLLGPQTSLAYTGSANFTTPGWGFGADRWTNVEAGVALLRRGKARSSLRRLIPPTCGEVPLDGGAVGLVTMQAEEEAQKPFPAFLRAVELRPEPGGRTRLELVVDFAEPAPGPFTLGLKVANVPKQLLSGAEGATGTEVRPLDGDTVGALLRQRAVSVHWHANGADLKADFPVNVSLDARHDLPFADPSALPRENELIAYYQGRIAFADVFPEVEEGGDGTTASLPSGSTVDTSEILSYRIREFVEALPGIRRELSESATTEPQMRLAFLGPVSPVALAREIDREVSRGRSTTAAGFQLVELLSLVRTVTPANELSPILAAAWSSFVSTASSEIQRLYDGLRQKDAVLGAGAFVRYEQTVLGSRGESR